MTARRTALTLGMALLCALLLLAGCGGGSEDDALATTQPVDCKARPELCK